MLASVNFILLHKLSSHDFPYEIADILTEFLIQDMPLHRACALSAFESTDLQDWVWRRGLRDGESTRWTVAKLVHTNNHYFQWEFVQAMCESVRCGSVEKAQWMLDHFPGCAILEGAVKEAARCDRLAVLELFEAEQPHRFVEWTPSSMDEAARAGHWDLVHWLDERVDSSKSRRHTQIVTAAVKQHKVDEVKRLVERGFSVWVTFPPRPTRLIAHEEDWKECSEIIRFLLEGGHGDRNYLLQSALIQAVELSDLEFTKWLVAEHTRDAENGTIYRLRSNLLFAVGRASWYGHVPVVEWLLGRLEGTSAFSRALSTAMSAAAEGGGLDVVKWLYNKYSEDPNIRPFGPQFGASRGTAMDIAAAYGQLDVLVYLHNIATEAREQGNDELCERLCCTNQAIDRAAANGHLDVIKWLHDNDSSSCSTKAMDSAASRIFHANGCSHDITQSSCCRGKDSTAFYDGQIAILDYLKENYDAGCTAYAMDGAAANGSLKMLQWLHDHTDAGCTTAAMNSAAEEGLLDVVQWLHENRPESCTARAMENAARNGHFHVVKWLHENRSEGDLMTSLRAAVASQEPAQENLPMVQWLLRSCSEVRRWPLILKALDRCRFEMALHLYSEIGGEVCDVKEMRETKASLQGWHMQADSASQFMVSWLEEEYPLVE